MDQTALAPPPFSRSRSTSQASNHSNTEGSQEHPVVAPERPLLSARNTREQLSQSTMPQIHTPTTVDDKRHRGRFSKALEQLEETWYIEAFLLLCSAACAALIVTLLTVNNNTHIESWRFHVGHFHFSINTVVSALGTVFKSTLLMAVSAALAQGKWTWFKKKSDRLSTFQAIDAGSHDTIGSFRLLWHMRGQHLVSAGALVMALGFMIEPFLQSSISEYGRLVDMELSNKDTSATIGRSAQLDRGTQCVLTYSNAYPKVDTIPDFAISASLYDGLNAALGHESPNVSFTCISGNCTWPEYVSIAIRSTCFDISNRLRRTSPSAATESMGSSGPDTGIPMYPTAPPSTSVITPLGPNASPATMTAAADVSQGTNEVEMPSYGAPSTAGLNKRASSGNQPPSMESSQSPATWTNWTLDHLGLTLSNTNQTWRKANTFAVLQAAVVADPCLTINFNNSQTLLAAFTIIRTNNTHTPGSTDWDAADASATECGLELALNVYNSSVADSVLLEQVVASVSRKVPGSWLPIGDQSKVLPNGLEADPGTLDSNPIYHDKFMYRDKYALDPSALQRTDLDNFTITQKTLLSTVNFLTSLIRQDNDNATVKAVQDGQYTLYTYGSPILQPLSNQTNTTAMFEAVAKSMSNAIRSIGQERMPGTTKQWVRFYQVRWAFLALPLSLITIGTIFFILSFVMARHLPSWKANSMATIVHGPDESLLRHLRIQDQEHSLAVASETMATLKGSTTQGFYLTAAYQPVSTISRPTTPGRDEEELEMDVMEVPTTPRTPGSAITLVDPQSVQEVSPKPEDIRSVSPVFTGPGWSEVSIDDPSTPLGSRRSV